MTKTRAIEYALKAANASGRAMMVLNFNPYSPLYVVREWRDGADSSRDFVCRVEPNDIRSALI